MSRQNKQFSVRFWLFFIFMALNALFWMGFINARGNDSQQTQEQHTCACTLNCMDRRVQRPVEEGTKKECRVDGVDVITQAGMVKVLAENEKKFLIDNFREEIELSVKEHGTKKVTIVAHHDCVGNPVSKEKQIEHLRQAKKTVESFNLGVEIILLWVDAPFKKAEVIK